MLLEGRNAIIYGGGGPVGGAVARAFARDGAKVFLAGRTMARLETVAAGIRAEGGTVACAEVDALDEQAVDAHTDSVGTIDVSVNVIADSDVQGTPIVDMSLADYLSPVVTAVSSKFLTSRAAARHMIRQGGGVIMALGGTVDRSHGPFRDYNLGGMGVTFDAVESMRRQLATELARYGIRVITLRTNGLPETIAADHAQRESISDMIAGQTLTGRAATLDDMGRVAVFAASDWASTLSGAAINMTCGAELD